MLLGVVNKQGLQFVGTDGLDHAMASLKMNRPGMAGQNTILCFK
jgi:hypothetical protein